MKGARYITGKITEHHNEFNLISSYAATGTIDIYALQSRDSSPDCHHALLVFCQVLYSAYDVLYLVVLLVNKTP